MKVQRRLEHMQAWEKVLELTSVIYTRLDQNLFSNDPMLYRHILKISTLMMFNFAASLQQEDEARFIESLTAAESLAMELETMLYDALNQSYINKETFANLVGLITESNRMIYALTRMERCCVMCL